MAKRPSLRREVPAASDESMRALDRLEGAASTAAAPRAAGGGDTLKRDTHAPTTLNLDKDLVELLRLIATGRAKEHGGRPSVSAVVEDILERHRSELLAELPPRYRRIFAADE